MHRLTSNTLSCTQLIVNFHLARVTGLQAWIRYKQHRFEAAKSETLRAADIYKKFGVADGMESCRILLQEIEKELSTAVASGQSDFDCELSKILLLPACIN
jgi:hypothetical protein